MKMFYNQPMTRVINNGHQSEIFGMLRGVRQGCPLSPGLFVIAIDVVGNWVRKKSTNKGH